MNITIDVICYKYTILKNGESPLKLRITKDRKRKYINLGISVESNYWDFDKNLPKPNCPNKLYIEKLIADKIGEYRTKVLELKVENKEFTAYSLVEPSPSKRENTTAGELFLEHINNLKAQKRHGYAASMQQVYNSLLAYNKHLEIPFSDIDVQWLRKYELWLRNDGKSENTIGVRFRTLRAVYNRAIEEEIVKPELYPFKRYKVSKLSKATIKRAITKEEMMQVINYQTRGDNHYTTFAIDLFTFSYLMGGINFADIAYLTKKNIIDNIYS